ncbi:ligase-associated DNA damage response exonuclease [soil metagenome]
MADLIVNTPRGLYCPPGDFYIDPWQPVDRAVITHAHADHARMGHGHYLASSAGERVLRARLGEIDLQPLDYGQVIEHNGVRLSLHPAGHVLGSAQVRVEHGGQVWVASGDYKLMGEGETDPTCASFEPVRCDVFITESTFGLPIYRWTSQRDLFADINGWWRANAEAGRASVLYGYSFGKAQRLLSGVDASIGPIFGHGAVMPLNEAYRASGVALPDVTLATTVKDKQAFKGALIVAPPSARGSTWARRFGDHSDAFASGWMALRGARRRQALDRGFVMSDHADWPGLMKAIRETGADRIIVTHGYVAIMVRWLNENGYDAGGFDTEYGHDEEEGPEAAAKAGPAETEPLAADAMPGESSN